MVFCFYLFFQDWSPWALVPDFVLVGYVVDFDQPNMYFLKWIFFLLKAISLFHYTEITFPLSGMLIVCTQIQAMATVQMLGILKGQRLD